MISHEWLALTIGAILVNNVVLLRILGICPFLGVSKKIDTALGMGGAVVFVMTVSSFATAVLYKLLLSTELHFCGISVHLGFMKILLFIVVIASLVQIMELVLKKLSPPLYEALGIYLPLITTNCAVLGAAELNAAAGNGIGRGILESTVFGFSTGVGFALALILFASLRERLELSMIPKPFQGAAIALITAGILSLAFLGFAGLV